MEVGSYNFLADWLSTFRSSSDLIKALIVLSPARLVLVTGALGIIGAVLWQRPCPRSRQCRVLMLQSEIKPHASENIFLMCKPQQKTSHK